MTDLIRKLRTNASTVTLGCDDAENLALLIEASGRLQNAWMNGVLPSDDDINSHYACVLRVADDYTNPSSQAGDWRLVPVVATEAMLIAGFNAYEDTVAEHGLDGPVKASSAACWKAMLASAPQPPGQEKAGE